MSRARFITFEGIDGAGKSTHLGWFAAQLRRRGHEVVVTREPGGTPLSETLREIVLSEAMHLETEVLLMFAARQEHLESVIRPALSSGRWIVCDRFTDATYAYQGGGRGVPAERIAELERWIQGGLQPDLTLVFDLPAEIARLRLIASQPRPDRFEREDEAFFQRVRDTYLSRARSEPGRIRVIDSARTVSEVQKELEDIIIELG